MNFFDMLSKTSYDETTKNYVASFIMDYFSEPKLNTIYLVSKSLSGNTVKDNIFLIQKTIELKPEKKDKLTPVKIVRILIYIPKDFPNAVPKFYLERAENHSIVEVQKDVNHYTYEITVKSISEWKTIDDLNKILNDIINSFLKIYPLYKLEIHKRKNINYPENSFIPNNATKVFLNDSANINNNNNKNINLPIKNIEIPQNVNNNNMLNLNMNNNFNQINYLNNLYKPQEEKVNFTDEEIKKILVDQTSLNVKDKLSKHYYENKNSKMNIDNMKNYLTYKTNEIGEKLIEGNKIMTAFEKLLKELNNEKAKIKDDIIKNAKLKLSFDNFREFVEIPQKEEQILKFTSMESTLDDLVFSLKKAFEKNALTFDETMKYTRKISKEIFVINFLKKKLIEE